MKKSKDENILAMDNLYPNTSILTLYKHRYVVMFMKILRIPWTASIIVQVIYFLYKFKFDIVLQYGPAFMFNILLLVVVWTSSPAHQRWLTTSKHFNKCFSIDPKLLTPKLKATIFQEVRKLKIGFFMDMSLHILVIIIIIIRTVGNTPQYYILSFLLKTYIPSLFIFFVCFGFISNIFLTLTLCSSMYFDVTLNYFLKYQFNILQDYALHNFQRTKNMLEQEYNIYVRRNLKFITKWHQEIVLEHGRLQNATLSTYIILELGVIFCVCEITLAFFSPYYGQLYAFLVLTGILFKICYVSFLGQKCEDTSASFQSTLYNLEWYTWNRENRKIFSILFLNTSKILTVGYKPIRVNLELFKHIMKLIYSTVNVMRSVSST